MLSVGNDAHIVPLVCPSGGLRRVAADLTPPISTVKRVMLRRQQPPVRPSGGFLLMKIKPPLKGVTPHGVGRCPQGRGDRSVRGGPAKLVEGFWWIFLELQISEPVFISVLRA